MSKGRPINNDLGPGVDTVDYQLTGTGAEEEVDAPEVSTTQEHVHAASGVDVGKQLVGADEEAQEADEEAQEADEEVDTEPEQEFDL